MPLGAHPLTSAAANRKYRDAEAQFLREKARALGLRAVQQKHDAGQFDPLTPELVAHLGAVLLNELRTGADVRLQEGHGAFGGRAWAWLLPQLRKARVAGDRALLADIFGPTVDGLIADEGLRLDPDDPEIRPKLIWALCAVLVSAAEDFEKQWEGYAPPIPPRPARPVPRAPAEPSEQRESFEAIVEALLESPTNPASPTTKEAVRTALRFFRETHGTPSPSAINRALVADWLELLVQRPAKLLGHEVRLPLPQVVALYADRPDVARLAPKTVSHHLSMLAARWTQAGRRGSLDRDAPNPFKDHDLQRPSKRRLPKGFSEDELRSIFSLPIFTEGVRPLGGKGEASYWVPLLLLCTGARPEEIAQLIVSDIFKDPRSGRWLLRITDEGEHPHKRTRSLKTSETGAGPRTFPLPKPLIDLGLLGYIKELTRAKEVALFPRLRTKSARGMLYAGLGEWWSKYLKANGVHLQGTRRQPMRELRHTWSTVARKAKVPREVMAYIQGHSLPDATSGDDYGDRSPLGLAVDSLTFEGVDFAAIRPWVPSESNDKANG